MKVSEDVQKIVAPLRNVTPLNLETVAAEIEAAVTRRVSEDCAKIAENACVPRLEKWADYTSGRKDAAAAIRSAYPLAEEEK